MTIFKNATQHLLRSRIIYLNRRSKTKHLGPWQVFPRWSLPSVSLVRRAAGSVAPVTLHDLVGPKRTWPCPHVYVYEYQLYQRAGAVSSRLYRWVCMSARLYCVRPTPERLLASIQRLTGSLCHSQRNYPGARG